MSQVLSEHHGRRWSRRRWRILGRLARRDVLRNSVRFLLAALVIGLTVGAGVSVDTLLRSANVTDTRYAQLSLGGVAAARVEWYGARTAQQTPRADLATGGGADASVAQVTKQLHALVPSSTKIIVARQSAIALRFRSSLTDGIGAMEADFAEPLLNGVIVPWAGVVPSSPGEVSVSRSVAERLHLAVGDTLQARVGNEDAFTELRLVGIHQNNPLGTDIALASGSLLPAPATSLGTVSPVWYLAGPTVNWDRVLALNKAGFVTISRQVVLNPPPSRLVPIYQDGTAFDGDVSLGIAVMVTAVVLVGGTLIVLLIGPVFAIGARQSRRDYALLMAQGARGSDVTGVMLLSSALTGAIAAAAGTALGLSIAATIVAIATAAGSTAFPNLVLPWADSAALAVFGALVALLAAWQPARRAAREDPVVALRGNDTSPTHPPKSRRALILTLAGGAAAVVGVSILTGSRVWLLAAGVLATAALILAIRIVLPAVSALAGRWAFPARIAIRDAARRPDRTIPTVTGVAAAIAFAMCVATVAATQFATAAADWHPRAAPGTIMIYDGTYVERTGSDNPFETSSSEAGAGSASTITTKADRARVAKVIREFIPSSQLADVDMLSLDGDRFPKMLIDPKIVCPAWADNTANYDRENGVAADPSAHAHADSQNCLIDKQASDINYEPSWDSTDHSNIVVDDGTLVSALNLPGAAQAAAALRAGKIVLTSPLQAWPDGTAHLGIMEDDKNALAQWNTLLSTSDGPVYQNPPDPLVVDTLTADAVVMQWPSAQWQAFIPPSLLTRALLAAQQPLIERVGLVASAPTPLDAHPMDELRAELLALGVHQVTMARDYTNAGLATTLTLVTLIASLIALAATWGTTRLAIDDLSRDLRTLDNVGASPRTRRRIVRVLSLLIGLLGSVTGTLAGIGLGAATSAALANNNVIGRGSWTLTIPWAPTLTIALLVPLLTTLIVSIGSSEPRRRTSIKDQ